jgi:Uma2 family endonuclease
MTVSGEPSGKEGRAMSTTSKAKADVFYPESDGEPMGETIDHRDSNIDLILSLQDWFADDPLAYVSGDDFIYYAEGQPRFVVSPDVWVTRGIDKTIRRQIYKTWLEGGKGPELVVEVTSRSTRREDKGKKFRIYQNDLKVHEYFLFDPLDEYLDPVLQGFRLVEGEYRPIEPVNGRLPSEVLGLHLEAEGIFIKLFNPITGERLLNRLERIEREKEARLEANARFEALQNQMQRNEAAKFGLVDLPRDQQAMILRFQQELAQSHQARQAAELAKLESENALLRKEIEFERLRQELEAFKAAQDTNKPKPKPKRK